MNGKVKPACKLPAKPLLSVLERRRLSQAQSKPLAACAAAAQSSQQQRRLPAAAPGKAATKQPSRLGQKHGGAFTWLHSCTHKWYHPDDGINVAEPSQLITCTLACMDRYCQLCVCSERFHLWSMMFDNMRRCWVLKMPLAQRWLHQMQALQSPC